MSAMGTIQEVKLRAGNRLVRSKIWEEGNEIFLATPYNKTLLAEIKSFDGAKWHGYDKVNPRKVWSIKSSSRNWFQLRYLMGENPYALYDAEWVPHTSSRPLLDHQIQMIRHARTVHYCIWAAEMGCAKTLAAIEVMEASGFKDWYYIGPRSALAAVRLEFRKWNAKIQPVMMTYEKLRSIIDKWDPNDKAPHGVIFDESSKVKTPSTLRSQAAMQLAEGIREDWGMDGYSIEMSGSPAPKSPVDWWNQCEIACPGFLKEGNIHKFKNRLGIIVQREQPITGGVYPHLVTWLDDEKKCAECGEYENHPVHNIGNLDLQNHRFTSSKNEVAALYRRMKGLVLVFFKKDCTDLPDKFYKIVECKPSPSTLRTAEALVNSAPRVITGMERMRELSDGFQYREEIIGEEECPLCHGSGEIVAPVYDESEEDVEKSELDKQMSNNLSPDPKSMEKIICDKCGGNGIVDKTQRIIQEVPCPKVSALINLLDEYSDCGRLVIYGGFTGSVDRIVKTCLSQKWSVLRADGRGWQAFGEGANNDEMLVAMDRTHPDRDRLMEKYPRLAFVGQPGAAGMGLNLTASPAVIYYSNDFNAESRIQSEDRIHRIGMDGNRGATIIDIVHLESDYKVLQNLKQKRKLQAMSLGDFRDILKSTEKREEDVIMYEE